MAIQRTFSSDFQQSVGGTVVYLDHPKLRRECNLLTRKVTEVALNAFPEKFKPGNVELRVEYEEELFDLKIHLKQYNYGRVDRVITHLEIDEKIVCEKQAPPEQVLTYYLDDTTKVCLTDPDFRKDDPTLEVLEHFLQTAPKAFEDVKISMYHQLFHYENKFYDIVIHLNREISCEETTFNIDLFLCNEVTPRDISLGEKLTIHISNEMRKALEGKRDSSHLDSVKLLEKVLLKKKKEIVRILKKVEGDEEKEFYMVVENQNEVKYLNLVMRFGPGRDPTVKTAYFCSQNQIKKRLNVKIDIEEYLEKLARVVYDD